MIRETTSVLVMMDVQANAAPRASEPVSPIKMLAGIAVEPQKAQAGTGTRGAEDGQVHVSVQKRHGSHGEHGNHGGAASKTVKAIGQVHGIRKTGDHQPAKDNVEPRERKAADGGRKHAKVNRQAAGKTNLGGDAAPVTASTVKVTQIMVRPIILA